MPIVKVKLSSFRGQNWTDADVVNNTIISDAIISANDCYPAKMVCDQTGDVYFCCLTSSQGIYKIIQNKTGYNVALVAGSENESGYVNSTQSALDARFSLPSSICYGANNVIYVADAGNSVIRYIKGGKVGVYFGLPGVYGTRDGEQSVGTFSLILDINMDNSGNMYVLEFNKFNSTSMLRRISNGRLTTIAGGAFGDAENVPVYPLTPTFTLPFSMCTNAKGDVLVSDMITRKIKKVVVDGLVSRYSGNGSGGFSLGTAPNWGNTCSYSLPYTLARDKSKNLYLIDAGAGMLLRIDETGRPYCIANFNSLATPLQLTSMAITRNQEIYLYLS